MTASERLLASLARKGGGAALDRVIARLLPEHDAPAGRGRNLLRGLAAALAVRAAQASVPGAIVVGSGVLAKVLYDRRRRRAAGQKAPPKA